MVQFERLIQKQDAMIRLLENIQHDVYGNGKPGIKTDVHDLKKHASISTKAIWLMFGAAAVAVVEMIARRTIGI